MREFVEASDALVAVLRAFLRGSEQRDYPVPSIALDEATRRYEAAKAAVKVDLQEPGDTKTSVSPKQALEQLLGRKLEPVSMEPAIESARKYAKARCAARLASEKRDVERHWRDADRISRHATGLGAYAVAAVKRMKVILQADQSINDPEHAMFVAGFTKPSQRSSE